MSHLTEYSFLLENILRLLEGQEPSRYSEYGKFGGEPVRFPLIAALDDIEDFYQQNQVEVERSRLRARRKYLYRDFISAAYRAYQAVTEGPRYGSVWHLQSCVSCLIEAFKIVEEAKDLDDTMPVHWSEVYRGRDSERDTSPQEYWLLFKLESLRPVLWLSVRILRLILPDCKETWYEWENTLCQETWLQQFIIDSRASSYRGIPLHAPTRDEVIDTTVCWTYY